MKRWIDNIKDWTIALEGTIIEKVDVADRGRGRQTISRIGLQDSTSTSKMCRGLQWRTKVQTALVQVNN